MSSRQRVCALLLVGLYLSLVGGAVSSAYDFAWSPSYFDDDDGDFLAALLDERAPALAVPSIALLAILAAPTIAVSALAAPRALLARDRSRLRAPPRLLSAKLASL